LRWKVAERLECHSRSAAVQGTERDADNRGGLKAGAGWRTALSGCDAAKRGLLISELSLEAAASFLSPAGLPPAILRTPVRVDGVSALAEVWQPWRTRRILRAAALPEKKNCSPC
jgi:hypothetical protein